jgi:alcohol dehydrogenase class IV
MMAAPMGVPFEFFAPNKFIFGLGTASRVAEEVKAFGGTKVLLVTDKVLMEKDVIRPVLDSLESARVPYVLYDRVEPDAPARLMVEAHEVLKAEGCDLVIGFGGGSSIDTAKGASLFATNGTDVRSMLGWFKVEKPGIPKIVLSTTNVAGADVGHGVVLTVDEEAHEHGFICSQFSMPDVAINDPLLTVSMPKAVTADTGVDTLVTAIECLTGSQANVLSDFFCEKTLEICARYLPVVVARGSDIEARTHMALAASMTGYAYMSSFIGAVHGMSYGVAGACSLTHGRSMAALLPAIMRFNIPGNPAAFCRVAQLLGVDTSGLTLLEGAEASVVAVEGLLDSIGVAHRLRDYGLAEDDLDGLLDETYEPAAEDFLVSNARFFNREDAATILRDAC